MLFDVRVLTFDRGQTDTVQSLMRVFKIDEERATHIASSVPRVVKSGAPLETARRLSHILAALGARTEVVASGTPKKAAVGEGLRTSQVDLPEHPGQFALPRPNPALGQVLSRTPANGNGNGNGTSSVRSKNVAVLRLAKMRAKRTVEEVPAGPDKVRRDSSVYMGRVRPGSAPDPSLLRRSNSDLPEGLEADIQRPSRVDVEPRPVPRVAEPTLRLAKKPRDEASAVLRTSSVLTGLILASLSVLSLGILPVILLGLWGYGVVRRASLVRSLEASAVRVSSAQLPELHAQLVAFTEQLGLLGLPRLYVTPSARGLTLLSTRGAVTLMLSADTLADCAEEERLDVISFLVAHELSALALGQRTPFRTLLRWAWPAVHKLDVLAADERAAKLLGARDHVSEALLALLAGPRALLLFERSELERQAVSHDAEGRSFTPALPGQPAYLLSRLSHMRRAT